jgi:hypothetical protein
LIAGAVLAVVRTRGSSRAAVVLYTVAALALLVTPPALSSYDARYAVPPAALLMVPAVVGIATLTRRT